MAMDSLAPFITCLTCLPVNEIILWLNVSCLYFSASPTDCRVSKAVAVRRITWYRRGKNITKVMCTAFILHTIINEFKLFSLQTTSQDLKSNEIYSAFTEKRRHIYTHFEPGPGKQELYTQAGIYISCVEFHSILSVSIGKPNDLLGRLLEYFFDDATLASSVPLQETRSKDKCKRVLDQRIVKSLICNHTIFTPSHPLSGRRKK